MCHRDGPRRIGICEHCLAKLAQTCTPGGSAEGRPPANGRRPRLSHPSKAKPRVTRGPQGLPFPALMSQGISNEEQKEHASMRKTLSTIAVAGIASLAMT